MDLVDELERLMHSLSADSAAGAGRGFDNFSVSSHRANDAERIIDWQVPNASGGLVASNAMGTQAADRLRQARERAGYETAQAAAEAMGVKVATYIQHENGTRGLTADRARRYATFFKTTPEWLLYGRSKGQPDQMARIIGRVGADPEGVVLFAHGQSTWDLAPVPPGTMGSVVALEVVGHSLRGVADNGSLVYIEEQHTQPTSDMLGHVVVVELDTDEVLIKRLLRGSKPGLFDLESIVGPTRHDAKIRWVAHVTAIIPPFQARRVIIRHGERAA